MLFIETIISFIFTVCLNILSPNEFIFIAHTPKLGWLIFVSSIAAAIYTAFTLLANSTTIQFKISQIVQITSSFVASLFVSRNVAVVMSVMIGVGGYSLFVINRHLHDPEDNGLLQPLKEGL